MIREVARIDEQRCIGCARCLPACPFDAIVGAKKYMHTVLIGACTGCELCIAPCPVDCITMAPRSFIPEAPTAPNAQTNRRRVQAHIARHAKEQRERQQLLAAKKLQAQNLSRHDPGAAR